MRHPRAVISYTQEDVYSNIADAVTPENRSCIDLLYKALEEVGVKAKTIAMRGGTDGSYISTQGIPTPNYFTEFPAGSPGLEPREECGLSKFFNLGPNAAKPCT